MQAAPRGGGSRGGRGGAAGRGRGRGRGDATKRNSVKFLVKNAPTEVAPENREKIEQEVAQLLAQTDLYKEQSDSGAPSTPASSTSALDLTKTKEETNELEELERKLIPPPLRFPKPREDFVEQVSRDVEWCAEVTSITAKLNAGKPQEALDHLKSVPIEKWPGVDHLWKSLWTKRSGAANETVLLEQVFEAFSEDLKDLDEGLSRSLGPADQRVKRSQVWENAAAIKMEHDATETSRKKRRVESSEAESPENPQWLVDYLETTGKATNLQSKEPFWNVADPDDEIYTDSEEDEVQTSLRHAPFVRPLRKIVRDLKRKEQLYTICGRSLRVFDETQSAEEIVKDNIEVVENVLFDSEERQKRLKRQKWRQWVNASKYAQWKTTAVPSLPLRQIEANMSAHLTPELADTLKSFQVISESDFPASRFCRAFLRHFGNNFPHTLDSNMLQRQTAQIVWPQAFNPFEWRVPDRAEICGTDGQNTADDTQVLRIRMAQPGQRFYVGRATTTWGGPVNAGYQRVQMAMEFFFWLKRLTGHFSPLHSVAVNRSRKQRPRKETSQLAQALSAFEASETGEVGDGSALAAAQALQSGEIESSAIDVSSGGAWGVSTRVTTERDSSESEGELQGRLKELAMEAEIDKDPSKKPFQWTGFAHDNDVVRIGRYGHLRNSWSRQRRRRLGLEAVPSAVTGTPSGRPIAPDYSSSEDSCNGMIDDQKKYREKPRITRRLIKKQKERVLDLRRAMRASTEGKESRKKRDKEAETLSSLYGHHLGPLHSEFATPSLRLDWPGSPLDLFEKRQADIALSATPALQTGQEASQLENRLEMALSSAQRLGLQEECWTHLTDKKGRVRGMEPKMDLDPTSKIPLGFLGFGADLQGSEYQLVGVDTNEFWRRMGDNKAMHQGLIGFEDLLKGCRDYYAVIDEDSHEVTIIPGASLSLFWTKSAKQNYNDLHWKSMWSHWLTGRFRRRFAQKALRYLKMRRQGFYCWQEQLDGLLKIADRISEGAAFRKAKYTRFRSHTFSARRDLDKRACPDLNVARTSEDLTMEDERMEDEKMEEERMETNDSSGGMGAIAGSLWCEGIGAQLVDEHVILGGKVQSEGDVSTNEGPSDSSDWEDGQGPGISRGTISQPADVEKEAEQCRVESERLFMSNGYSTMFNRPRTNEPKWALAWKGGKATLRSKLSSRYGHLVSRYFHAVLPKYSREYREARKLMAEKHKAEMEFTALSKRIQQKKAEMGGRPSGSSVLDQQLAGAVLVMEEAEKAQGIQTTQRKALTAEELAAETRENNLVAMRMCLPAFSLEATNPADIYKLDDVLPTHLLSSMDASPILEYLEGGYPMTLQGNSRWTKVMLQLLQSLRSHQLASTTPSRQELTEIARKLKLLNWLVKFYTYHHRNFRHLGHVTKVLNKESESSDPTDKSRLDVPDFFSQWLTDTFLTPDEKAALYMKKEGETKLMVTILWLILHLNGEWKFDFQSLLNLDWNDKYTEKFQSWARLMGMKRIWKGRKPREDGMEESTLGNEIQTAQEWELLAPLTVADVSSRGVGLVGAADAAFGKSAAGVFFKEDAAKQALQARRGGRGRGRGRGRGG